MKQPTRIDISVVCTQDQGKTDDPIANAVRAALHVAHRHAKDKYRIDGHISFHSEVKPQSCRWISDVTGPVAQDYDY